MVIFNSYVKLPEGMFFLNAPFSVGLHHLWIRWLSEVIATSRSLAPRHLRCSGTLRLAHCWKLTVDRNVATKSVNFAVRQLEIQQRQNSLSSNRRTCCPMPQVSRLWKQSLKVWLPSRSVSFSSMFARLFKQFNVFLLLFSLSFLCFRWFFLSFPGLLSFANAVYLGLGHP